MQLSRLAVILAVLVGLGAIAVSGVLSYLFWMPANCIPPPPPTNNIGDLPTTKASISVSQAASSDPTARTRQPDPSSTDAQSTDAPGTPNSFSGETSKSHWIIA